MALSLNQVEQTARKAVRGAGLPWGLAEDAGRAVRRLEMLEFPGMVWLSSLLDTLPHDRLDPLRIESSGEDWRAVSGIMSPLLAGPSVADWIGLQGNGAAATLHLAQIACPGLCIGNIANVLQFSDLQVRLEFPTAALAIDREGLTVIRGVSADFCGAPQDVLLETARSGSTVEGVRYLPRVGSRDVDPCALGMLESLAHRTYVEASETSRLSGAGAGLQDND